MKKITERDKEMKHLPMVVIDTETGGLDCNTDALLSIAAYNPDTKVEFYVQIKAADGMECGLIALDVNGLDPNEGELETNAMTMFAKWLARQGEHVIAGANVKFDIGFIEKAFERVGLRYHISHRVLDVQSMAFMAYALGKLDLPMYSGVPKVSLDCILGAMDAMRDEEKHSALEDVKLTSYAIQSILARCDNG
jgi:DNA polymerase III epsilon subunit-like protein